MSLLGMERREQEPHRWRQKIKPVALWALKQALNYTAHKIMTGSALYWCCGKTAQQLVEESIEYKVASYGIEKASEIVLPSCACLSTSCALCTVGCAGVACCVKGYRQYFNDPRNNVAMDYLQSDKKNK
jgi:hypothetical protein